MAILNIVTWPDSRLKQKSEIVKNINQEIKDLVSNMFDTMYSQNGIGLAAVQIGVMKRIITIDIGNSSSRYPDDENNNKNPLCLINPEIINNSNQLSSYKEGCLSFPQQFSNVTRPKEITVQYLNENGEKKILNADGLLATCIQHEIDHINGIVFIDHISSLKRNMIERKIKKINKLRA